MRKLRTCIVLCAVFAVPACVLADAPAPETVLGRVVRVVSQKVEPIEGTNLSQTVQELSVKVLEGFWAGREVSTVNNIIPLDVGDRVYLTMTPDEQGEPMVSGFGIADPYRLPVLGWLAVLFLVLVILLGGWQGIRGLASLIGGFVLILFVFLPGILHGFSPIALSIGVSALIIIVGSYITHGFNRTTTSAVVGMTATILVVGFLALYVVHAAHLTGMETEEAFYLAQNTGGQVDLVGLLLGGMLIGLLGVLYDISIGQAISVEELRRASPDMHATQLYRRATRIGREHIGALVNTLAIAYVGVSLPLLLVFYSEHSNIRESLNQEVFAAEIVRILIGSIGLVIAVPITTVISVAMLRHHHFEGTHTHGHSHGSQRLTG